MTQIAGRSRGILCQWAVAFSIAMSLATAPSAQAQEVRLSPKEARVFAAQLGKNGQFRAMREVALGLLKADPKDFAALLLLSRAQSELGQHGAAIRNGKRAWAVADDDTQRFAASYAVAQGLNADKRLTEGQFWLRRAAQYAPDERLGEVAQSEFQKMRRRNPLQVELRFSAKPSNNVNNGTREAWSPDGIGLVFVPTGGLLPLSGTEIASGVTLNYTLAEGAKSRTRLGFELDHRTYALSSEAKRTAPGVRGDDFAFTSATLRLRRDQAVSDKTVLNYGVSAGRLWYGGDPLSDFARLEAGALHRLGTADSLQIIASAEVHNGHDRRRDSQMWQLTGVWHHKLGNGDRLQMSLGGLVSQSDDVTMDYRQVQAGISYRKAKPLAGMGLEFGLNISHRRHDVFAFSADGQTGGEARAHIAARLENLDYYGFVPVLKLEAAKRTSNIPLYESESLGLSLGVRSAF